MCSPAQAQSEEVGFTSRVSDKKNDGPAVDPVLIEELAIANRILFREGVVDGFGHISVRHDKRPDHFLLARNMAPALVTVDETDLDGPVGRVSDQILDDVSRGLRSVLDL